MTDCVKHWGLEFQTLRQSVIDNPNKDSSIPKRTTFVGTLALHGAPWCFILCFYPHTSYGIPVYHRHIIATSLHQVRDIGGVRDFGICYSAITLFFLLILLLLAQEVVNWHQKGRFKHMEYLSNKNGGKTS